ncbi:MAG: transcription elongation factor GreA [Acidimicrobiia bacterium]
MATTRLTQEAFDRLQGELAELESSGRTTIQERILNARELGDLRENAEYHQAKEDQAFLEGRILELRRMLEEAEILEGVEDTSKVTHGTKVTLRDEDGDVETYVFTSTHNKPDTDLPVVSPESALGAALEGRAVGDSVTYEAPGGKFTVEVTAIEVF